MLKTKHDFPNYSQKLQNRGGEKGKKKKEEISLTLCSQRNA